jgi:hypothetical protein
LNFARIPSFLMMRATRFSEQPYPIARRSPASLGLP